MMQNEKDIRLTELPPPPPSGNQEKQPEGGTDLNDSPISNVNKQKSQEAAAYVNSRPNRDKLEDAAYLNDALKPRTLQQGTENGAYLNDAHRPKMSREKIPDVNELYLQVGNAPPPLQKTERPTTVGKLLD